MCEIAKVAKVSKCLLFLNYIKMKMVSCFDYYFYFFGGLKFCLWKIINIFDKKM